MVSAGLNEVEITERFPEGSEGSKDSLAVVSI